MFFYLQIDVFNIYDLHWQLARKLPVWSSASTKRTRTSTGNEMREIEQVLLCKERNKKCRNRRLWKIYVVSENYNRSNKKFDFELMLKRRAKTYSSSCSQTVSLSPAIISQFILGVCAAAKDRKKSIKIPNFESSASFKVIDVDTTEKFVTSACCDRQHAHAYLQPFSRNTGQQR